MYWLTEGEETTENKTDEEKKPVEETTEEKKDDEKVPLTISK